MRAATQVSADEEAIPIVGRVSVMQVIALDRRCAGAAGQARSGVEDIGGVAGEVAEQAGVGQEDLGCLDQTLGRKRASSRVKQRFSEVWAR